MTLDGWRSLDPGALPRVVWGREPRRRDIVVLLGAFDPPTNAHLEILTGAAERSDAEGVLGLTKVRLARGSEVLLTDERRIEVLGAIAARCGFALAFANRGTYLDVDRALRADGYVPSFVVGSDKLSQLADPSFYPDGVRGVEATFSEVTFLVVPRAGAAVGRDDVDLLEPGVVFSDPAHRDLSATEIRRMIARGSYVGALVPPEVTAGIEGYTSAR